MQILAAGQLISVVAQNKDIKNGKKRFFAFRDGILYDPEMDFKPAKAGAHRPKQNTIDEYYNLLNEAEKSFNKLKQEYEATGQNNHTKPEVKEVIKEVFVEVPAASDEGVNERIRALEEENARLRAGQASKSAESKPASMLENLIAQSVAQIASRDVLEMTIPMLDAHIKQAYGVLPQVHEIRTADKLTKVTGIVHEKFETVLQLVLNDIPVFMTGPAGTGKNYICKQVAEAAGIEFYFSNAVTQEYKLTGFIDANGTYHETQFFKAFTQGGLFMLDEIDASTPDVLVVLNAAIANRYFDFPTGRVEAHAEFRLIAAGNTFGTGADVEYTGRYQLDASTLDRFALIEIDYSPAIEEALAAGDMELVRFIREFRKATEKTGLKVIVSYRSIERIRKLNGMIDLVEVIKMCLIKGIARDDLKIIERNLVGNTMYHDAFMRAV